MPTNRHRRTRAPEPEVSATVRDFLTTGEDPGGFEVLHLSGHPQKVKPIWDSIKEELLPDWIRKHPGTRPWAWWMFDAPRWGQIFDAFYDGQLPEPRRRIGGIGTPRAEVLAYVPDFAYGLPVGWVSTFDEAYYNGRAQDVYGNPVGTNYKEGDFTGVALDPADPPQFESQAVFLARHGLLTAAERKWLASHPEALEPEIVQLEAAQTEKNISPMGEKEEIPESQRLR